MPAGALFLFGVSCPSAGQCVAAGDRLTEFGEIAGTAVSTSDAGATWDPVGLAPEVSSLGGVSCADPGYCQSLGTTSQSEVILGEKPVG